MQVVVITRTPTPEATGEGGIQPPTSITATPTPGGVSALPAAPENLVAGGLLVAGYLAGGEADVEGCIPELVDAWSLAPSDGDRCLFADIDGDDVREFAFALTVDGGGSSPGDIWFFEGDDESYRLASSARVLANEVLESVSIEAVADLTGDTLPEVVISAQSCGASACVSRLIIASAHVGQLTNLSPASLDVDALDSIEVEDANSDGLPDLVISGGTSAVEGAGPPRSSRFVLTWGGLRFFVREEVEEPRYLFHAIVDADEKFAAREYADARSLYEAAAVNTALVDWRVETGQGSGRGELIPYAYFRAGLAALRGNDDAGALVLFARAADGFPSSLHGQAGAIYREALQTHVPDGLACQAVEDFLRPNSTAYQQIWDYGFANPQHQLADLCR